MYCGNCGKPNPDNAVFCQACGAKLTPSVVPVNPQPHVVSGGSVGAAKPIGRIVLIVLAVIMICVIGGVIWLGVSLFGGRGPSETAEQFWSDFYDDGDAEDILSLFPPDSYEEEEYEEAVGQLEDMLTYVRNMIQFQLGDDWKLSCKAIEEEKVDTEEKEKIIDAYDELGIDVSDARDVEVEITFWSKDREESSEITTPVIKVGKSWYLDAKNLADVLSEVLY